MTFGFRPPLSQKIEVSDGILSVRSDAGFWQPARLTVECCSGSRSGRDVCYSPIPLGFQFHDQDHLNPPKQTKPKGLPFEEKVGCHSRGWASWDK